MNVIDKFEGEYFYLSNFYPSELIIDNITYPTVEHAFQAMKTLDKNKRMEIAKARTPGEAKKMGRKIQLRHDWEIIKLEIMRNLVKLKFLLYPDLKDKLVATGETKLIEGNQWHDTYWGICNAKGENNLGKILMKIREELK